ncbi:MAG: TonB-dependent receptor [Caulobacteraceae bacterium]
MRMRTGWLASCGLLALVWAGSALAQTDPPAQPPASGIEGAPGSATVQELVVTAERRGAENLQKVPMAVDAYAGTTLQRLNVQSVQGLDKIDPSIRVQTFGADQEQIIIRGISSTTGQTTGVYFDEAPLEGGFNANIMGDNTPTLALHDINHVEVLKGPQGTLFGTGSMDGTLRIITNKPNLDQVEGAVEMRAAGVDGGNSYGDANAMINLPIASDKLAIRAVGWGEEGGGWIDQYIGSNINKNVNDVHLYGGRIEALWKPNDRFSLLASINDQSTRVDDAQGWTLLVGPLTAPGGPEEGPFPPYQNHSPTLEPYSSHYHLYTLTGQYDLGFGSIIATTSYGAKNQQEFSDTSASVCFYGLCAGGPGFPAPFSAHSQFHDWTDEIRFSSDFKGPFQVVAGAYYERDALQYDGAVIWANPATGAVPCPTYDVCVADGLVKPGFGVNPVEFANQDNLHVDQYAFYGQVDYKILRRLTATIGARYFAANLNDAQTTQQNIAPTVTPNGFDGGWVLGDVTTPYPSSASKAHESKPTFNVALRYDFTPDVSVYARAASGYRIGGINESATIASQLGITIPPSFAPDTLWDYEAGVKGFFLDHRLYVELTGYHIDWIGQQEDALAAGTYNYTLNVGSSTINGIEFNTRIHPAAGLDLAASATWVDATLAQNLPTSVVDAGTPGMAGDRLPYVPRFSLTGQAQYEHPLSDLVRGYIEGDFSYRSNSFSAFRPVTPAQLAAGIGNDFYTELPAYLLIDLKTGIRFGGFDLGVHVNNLTNKVAYVGMSAALDQVEVFTPPPRTIGVDFQARF